MRQTIGLIDVDSHNFPNLALMKLSSYHKKRGDHVEWWNGFNHYDLVYKSKVFDDTYTEDIDYVINADEVILGGTGYDLQNKLPEDIEHTYPDYGLYGISDTAFGFTTRGCPRSCPFCIVSAKESRQAHRHADVAEFYKDQKYINLLDANLLACKDHEDILKQLAKTKASVNFSQGLDARCLTEDNIYLLNKIKKKDIHFAWDFPEQSGGVLRGLELYKQSAKKVHGHFATVYVLTNFSTSHSEDLERIYKLREMDYDPFVMIYDKPNAPRETRLLQRWCNNKRIFRTVPRFEDYDSKK